MVLSPPMPKKKVTYADTAPKTAKAEALNRERLMLRKMEDLLALEDREEFKKRLNSDLGIKPDHPRFAAMLAVFDAQRR
jgi:hypothetical protein